MIYIIIELKSPQLRAPTTPKRRIRFQVNSVRLPVPRGAKTPADAHPALPENDGKDAGFHQRHAPGHDARAG